MVQCVCETKAGLSYVSQIKYAPLTMTLAIRVVN